MTTYYNEIDPFAAQWLRNLIAAGHIPAGDVDQRSITEVSPDDLKPYTQAHFFAGIAGWPLALRMADWDDERPVWTGSCPCQPFSSAGKQQGKADERHLWPVWFRLIAERRPPVVFGEQVKNAIAHEWLDETFYDLEGEGYACGAAVLPACSVTAPHRRDRLWFVADAKRPGVSDDRSREAPSPQGAVQSEKEQRQRFRPDAGQRGDSSLMANSTSTRSLPSTQAGVHRSEEGAGAWHVESQRLCVAGDVADTDSDHGHWWSGPLQVGWNCIEGQVAPSGDRERTKWLVKPGVPLLAHGIPGRVGRLRAYGNAIVPQVAAEFIKAYDDAIA